MSGSEDWAGILEAGETILWQGRPSTRLILRPVDFAFGAFGLVFAGFALFWMILAAQGGGAMWMFGLLHFSVGVTVMLGGPLSSRFLRQHSFYSLSNRRAFIATDLPFRGRRLDAWPITPDNCSAVAWCRSHFIDLKSPGDPKPGRS